MKPSATISLEHDPEVTDGIVTIWWWRKGNEFNLRLKSKKPIWKILSAYDIYLLYSSGGAIEVDEQLILKHFEVAP